MTLFGIGLSAFVGHNLAGTPLPPLPSINIPGLTNIPVLGDLLFHYDVMVYLSLVLFVGVQWFLTKVVDSTPANPLTFQDTLPPLNTLPATSRAIYKIDPGLRAPYIIQSAFSLERQVTKIANVTVSYLNARGVHQLLTLNVNAPLPGTPFSSGPRPDPTAGPINQYVSDGVFRQNQLIANFNIRAGTKLSLFGYYSLNYANSDTSGASSFPSNQYDLGADYGRASFDVRNRVFMGGTVGLPHGFRLSPFLIFTSGSPYNVTAGEDLSNDSLFNDRPAFATNVSGSCLSPTAACHYVVPTSSYIPIPINYLTGPYHFTLNLRLAKTFGFGPEVGGKSGAQQGGGPPGGGPLGGGGPRGGGGGGGGLGRGPEEEEGSGAWARQPLDATT